MEPQWKQTARDLGLLIVRLGIGGYMLTHGWGKLQMMLAGDFDKFRDIIGIGSGVSLVLVFFAEFVCALLVMIGLGTRLATVPLIVTMAVAAFMAHGNDPWTLGEARRLFLAGEAEHFGSKQPALMYLVVFVGLMLTGPGRLSIDALICRGKPKA